uniref:BTB domain-containing protein n=1 Tax=Oryza brachyantha TaxID=4533 RepID=J3MRD0_ORYBR
MADRGMDGLTGSAPVVVSGESLDGALASTSRPFRAIRSLPFAAGGHQWRLLFYPRTVLSGFFAAGAELLTGGKVGARSVAPASVGPVQRVLVRTSPPVYFDYSDADIQVVYQNRGWLSEIEPMVADHDLAVVFEMKLTVVPDEPPPAEDRDSAAAVGRMADDVPPSDMAQQLEEVFNSKEGADVAFSVDGEHFAAHRVILAMRSPVFRAAGDGGGRMKESDRGSSAPPITVDEIRPAVFGALLRYIYTDSLPPAITRTAADDDDDVDEHQQNGTGTGNDDMTCDLLVAADRYGVERLKLICERSLCKRLNAGNVADLLAMADRQHCKTLKEACIEFMATSGRMNEVAVSQGYTQLRSSRPLLLLEVLEKSAKFCKD